MSEYVIYDAQYTPRRYVLRMNNMWFHTSSGVQYAERFKKIEDAERWLPAASAFLEGSQLVIERL